MTKLVPISRDALLFDHLLLPHSLPESPSLPMSSIPSALEVASAFAERSSASSRTFSFPSLPHCALQLWFAFRPRLLRTTVAATATALPSDATGPTPRLVAIARPVRVRTTHFERQAPFCHCTANFQSVSCTIRERHVLALRSRQCHNLLSG